MLSYLLLVFSITVGEAGLAIKEPENVSLILSASLCSVNGIKINDILQLLSFYGHRTTVTAGSNGKHVSHVYIYVSEGNAIT